MAKTLKAVAAFARKN